jgi:hypothetical protein
MSMARGAYAPALPASWPVPGACAAAAGVISRASCRCVVACATCHCLSRWPRQGFGFIACSRRSAAGGVISLPAVRDLMKMFADELIIMPCLQFNRDGARNLASMIH